MQMELILLTPYAAIGASLLLIFTVALTCYNQESSSQATATLFRLSERFRDAR